MGPVPSPPRPAFARRLALAGGALVLGVAISAVAIDRWAERSDLWGVSFFEDVQRYFREAVEPVRERFGPGGRLFQNRAGVDLELRTFRYRTDAERLRRGAEEPRYHPERFEGLRILCLGDSVTLGWGVEDEASWPRIVEREGLSPDGSPVACLNAGHLMFDTVQEALLLDAWGPRHRPDVVLLTFVFNDLYPTWDQLTDMTVPEGERGEPAPAEEGFRWRPPSWLRGFLPRLTRLAGYLREERAFATDRMARPPFNYYPAGWPRCEAALERIAARCEELGARLVLAECNQYGPPLVELTAWCREREVPLFPITFSPEELALGVQNSRVDPHANALGNRLIAHKVLAALRANGVLSATGELAGVTR